MAWHSNSPEFKCSICGKGELNFNMLLFRKYYSIKNNIYVFFGIAEFYLKFSLTRHEKSVHSHTTEDDFVCDECPFRTKTKWNLDFHKKGVHKIDKVEQMVEKEKKSDKPKKRIKKVCKIGKVVKKKKKRR